MLHSMMRIKHFHSYGRNTGKTLKNFIRLIMTTVFKDYPKEKTAFLNSGDIIKCNLSFPELCVSTFSENIINEFFSSDNRKTICEICTANGNIPIYEMDYKNKRIAFFVSRIGLPFVSQE